MDRDEIVDSWATRSDISLMKGSKIVFFKKDVKIGIRRHPDRMHLQIPPLLSNDWGEVQSAGFLVASGLIYFYPEFNPYTNT